ncbi:hypothetical protein DFJ74DRAFT_670653 [Hyaloraphidium curvatum]|nr:hypothetical protein DFJ74DRAFT_670653 [Hyaloraphidium curvatum]
MASARPWSVASWSAPRAAQSHRSRRRWCRRPLRRPRLPSTWEVSLWTRRTRRSRAPWGGRQAPRCWVTTSARPRSTAHCTAGWGPSMRRARTWAASGRWQPPGTGTGAGRDHPLDRLEDLVRRQAGMVLGTRAESLPPDLKLHLRTTPSQGG